MARLPDTGRRPPKAWPALAVAVMALGACMSELPPLAPLQNVGVVQGRVSEGAQGAPARLQFVSDNGAALDVAGTVLADSTGWYRVELPLGTYRVRLRYPDIDMSVSSPLDTVVVGRAVRRRDFERSRARVTVALPEAFEGVHARLSLVGAAGTADRSTFVQNGIADFDLRLLPLSRYTMRLQFYSISDDFFLPATHAPNEADSLDVRFGAGAYEVDLRGRHASLSGRVTGSWQRSPYTMQMRAATVSGRVILGVECGRDGAFRLDTLMPEPVKLFARHHEIENWYGGGSQATAAIIDLHAGDHIEGLDMVEAGLDVHFDGPGDQVPDQHTLILRRDDGQQFVVRGYDENPIRISNLSAGRYRLAAGGYCYGEWWQPLWHDGAADPDGAAPVDVVAGEVGAVTVRLRAGASLVGRITGEGVGGFSHHAVFVRDGAGGHLCDQPLSMYAGRLAVDGLPDGDYCLSIPVYGRDWWYPGTWDQSQAAHLTIAGGNGVTGLVWPMPTSKAGVGS